MRTLIKFELKKLWMSRLNRCVFLSVCLWVLVGMAVSIFQTVTFDKEGNLMSGMDAVRCWKNNMKELEGTLTDERVGEIIQEAQRIRANQNDEDEKQVEELNFSYYYPRQGLFSLIQQGYYGSDSDDYFLDMSLEQRQDFYQARTEQIRSTLINGREDWQYTEAERQFWEKKNEQVETPIDYGYAEGWKWPIDSFGFFIVSIMALCIMLARIYAGEYESGAEHIILATKYGKTKVIAAKNLAALIFGGLFSFITIGIYLVVLLSALGIDGAGLPIQNYNINIAYPFTFVQAVLLYAGLCLVVAFGIMALLLFLSARMKTGLPVLSVSMAIIIGEFFLNPSNTNGVYNHIIDLLPYSAIGNCPFLDMYSYPFGDFVLDYPSMIFVVYITLGILLILFAGRAFRKHEVE